jgi:hypothetical protein
MKLRAQSLARAVPSSSSNNKGVNTSSSSSLRPMLFNGALLDSGNPEILVRQRMPRHQSFLPQISNQIVVRLSNLGAAKQQRIHPLFPHYSSHPRCESGKGWRPCDHVRHSFGGRSEEGDMFKRLHPSTHVTRAVAPPCWSNRIGDGFYSSPFGTAWALIEKSPT